MIRKKWSPFQKNQVAEKQDWKCNDCKNKLNASFDLDHIVALRNGGKDEIDNLQALCANCHRMKSSIETSVYYEEKRFTKKRKRSHVPLKKRKVSSSFVGTGLEVRETVSKYFDPCSEFYIHVDKKIKPCSHLTVTCSLGQTCSPPHM